MQEQMECLEALEVVEKDKKALENRLAAMAEGEGAATLELSVRLASTEEERGRACGEVEEMKTLLRGMDVEQARVGEERERLAEEVRRLVSVEEESTRMCAEVATLHRQLQNAEEDRAKVEEERSAAEKERFRFEAELTLVQTAREEAVDTFASVQHAAAAAGFFSSFHICSSLLTCL